MKYTIKDIFDNFKIVDIEITQYRANTREY